MGYYKGNRQIVLSFCLLSSCLTMCFCYVPASLLTTCCSTYGVYDHYIHPRIRIGVSMIEWILIIVFGLVVDEHGYVFYNDYGFTIFICGLICYAVCSQYLYFMPQFVMPHNVRIRSKWGYAFNGELEELKRMTVAIRYNETRNELIAKKNLLEQSLASMEVNRLQQELENRPNEQS